MEIEFTELAKKDLEYWRKAGNLKIQNRITDLLNSIIDNPFKGIGKPEPLKYQLAGKWSRRIDKENRLVYAIKDETIYIYSLKDHY
jgi:toxin YoeB